MSNLLLQLKFSGNFVEYSSIESKTQGIHSDRRELESPLDVIRLYHRRSPSIATMFQHNAKRTKKKRFSRENLSNSKTYIEQKFNHMFRIDLFTMLKTQKTQTDENDQRKHVLWLFFEAFLWSLCPSVVHVLRDTDVVVQEPNRVTFSE